MKKKVMVAVMCLTIMISLSVQARAENVITMGLRAIITPVFAMLGIRKETREAFVVTIEKVVPFKNYYYQSSFKSPEYYRNDMNIANLIQQAQVNLWLAVQKAIGKKICREPEETGEFVKYLFTTRLGVYTPRS